MLAFLPTNLLCWLVASNFDGGLLKMSENG